MGRCEADRLSGERARNGSIPRSAVGSERATAVVLRAAGDGARWKSGAQPLARSWRQSGSVDAAAEWRRDAESTGHLHRRRDGPRERVRIDQGERAVAADLTEREVACLFVERVGSVPGLR